MMGSQDSVTNLESLALAVKGNPSNNNDHRPKKGRPWCDHCRHPGHTKDTCWKIHGKPADWKPSRFANDKEGRGNLVSMDEKPSPEPTPFSKEQIEVLQKLFSQSLPAPTPTMVRTGSLAQKADGSLSKVAGTGSVRVSKNITLDSVLLVLDSRKTIGNAKMCSGLYLLEVNDPPQGATHHFDCSVSSSPISLSFTKVPVSTLLNKMGETNFIQEYQLWDIEESSHFSPNSDQPCPSLNRESIPPQNLFLESPYFLESPSQDQTNSPPTNLIHLLKIWTLFNQQRMMS
ncbi:hypothetical protein CK203_025356 [Vitis vinifera]|uniref:Uncharacterized protein n=1 Tax=Vitis vinifera TaxID=29760 RepID=A0A438IZI5_VITVI|nr:hypothetical protein CK203_025356 [Vitis vinifera]